MPTLSQRFVIAAPAAAVWEVIGPGFASIGEWATAIQTSTGVTHEPTSRPRLAARASNGSELIFAPVSGRVCSTGLSMVPEVTETLVDYDPDRRTLTYEAAGMPSFVTVARNMWTVVALDTVRSVVTLDAQFETRGIVGAVARWILLAQVRRTSRHLGDDLRHFVEYGTPSPRKRKQLHRMRRTAK